MAEDLFTFADSFTGLSHALFTTLLHRAHGCRTRLVTHTQSVGKQCFVLHTIHSEPAPRPNRRERGCHVNL
jgi:hypothetical protein